MNDLTNYITQWSWIDIISTWYALVDDAYQAMIARRGPPLRTRGPGPTFSDSEVITVSLIIETFLQGHEEVGVTTSIGATAVMVFHSGKLANTETATGFDRLC